MKTIITDTSFLIACAEFKIDYLTEFDRIMTTQYKVSVPDIVLKEFEIIEKKGNAKQKQAVKLAKTILQKKNINIVKTTETKTADQTILTLADKEKIIATIDAELKKKLKKKKIPLIVIRQKKYLTIMHA